MKRFLFFVLMIVLSTIVTAIIGEMECSPLDKDPTFYESLVVNSAVAHPEGLIIEKVYAQNCKMGKSIHVVMD